MASPQAAKMALFQSAVNIRVSGGAGELPLTYATYAVLAANLIKHWAFSFFPKLDVCGTYAVTYAARMHC